MYKYPESLDLQVWSFKSMQAAGWARRISWSLECKTNIYTKTTSSCSSGLSLAYGNFNYGLGFQATLALAGALAPSAASTPAPPRPWLWRLRSCCLSHLTSCPSEWLLHSLLASEPVGQGAMQGSVEKRRPTWGSAPVLSPPLEMESTVCGTASYPYPQLKVKCFFPPK